VPSPCLRLVALPDGVADTEQTANAVYEALSARAVEAQVVAFGGRGWVRLSAAPYNEPADYERLADVLPEVLASHA
jgi:isopenicillin-N epimerase